MVKKKTLTEKEVAKTWEIVRDITDDRQPDKKFPAGGFVTKENFHPETWKALVDAGDVVPAAPEDPLREDEVIVFEKVGG